MLLGILSVQPSFAGDSGAVVGGAVGGALGAAIGHDDIGRNGRGNWLVKYTIT